MPPLTRGVVHAWTALLDRTGDEQRQLAGVLEPAELERATRFRFPRDRRRFVACRGILRHLVAGYLEEDPRAVRFRYGPRGKPSVVTGAERGPHVYFNVAHAGPVGVLAFTLAGEVGVDVERVRRLSDLEAVANRYFAPGERRRLRAVTGGAARERAFFTCWTRKEAYVKARGDGLSLPLDGFEVTLAPDEPPRVLSIGGTAELAEPWRLYALVPAPGFVGALAHQGDHLRIVEYRWQPVCSQSARLAAAS